MRSCSSSISEIEQVGQQLGELVAYIAAIGFGAENLNIVRKLSQELTACAAGGRPVFAVSIDCKALELSVAFAYGLDAGGALGTNGAAEGCVFYIAAGEHATVSTLESGTNGKTGIGNISVKGSLLGFGQKISVGHGFLPFAVMRQLYF